jgi:hypothetical protein
MEKDIVGYEDYTINENGEIYSKRNKKFLKQSISYRGYHTVRLCNSDGQKTFRVHRLVATHFIPNPDELPQVDHIDEDKSNNHVSNLRWCTNKDNSTWFYKNNPKVINTGNKGKECIVNGVTYKSAYSAAKYIHEDSGRSTINTISKEIRRRNINNGDKWVMYDKYTIGY